jgi:hypothetical protein
MLEGPELKQLEIWADELGAAAEQDLGAVKT